MVGCAASDDHYTLEPREVEARLGEIHVAFGVEASREGGLEGSGLFVDLLEHEVLVAVETHLLGAPVNLEGLPPDRLARERPYLGRRAGEDHDLTVLHEEKPLRVAEQSLHRTRQKVLALPQPHDQRALVARRDDLLRLRSTHRRDRERTPKAPYRPRERFLQRLPDRHPLGQKVRDDLRVRLRTEHKTTLLQLLPELRVVLDDTIVDHRDLLGRAPGVRMGVSHAGAPVRRPPGMAHTAAHLEEVAVPLSDGVRQVVERAYLPGDLDPRFGQGQGKSRRVVTPVLQVPQALHEDLDAPLSADVTDDPAHHAPPRPGAETPEQPKIWA